MAETVVKIEDLRVTFFAYEGAIEALRGVSLEVAEGEILGIVGESGCGKSVLARAILRTTKRPGRVVGGRIVFLGADLAQKSDREMQYLRGRDIALIVSNPKIHLNPVLQVGAQITNVIQANNEDTSKSEARQRAQDLIEALGIGDPPRVMKSLPDELSGGMAQRILIAMALSNNPKLLLADEPSSGLDVTVQLQVLELMKALVRDHAAATIIMTRDLGVVAHYCDRIIVMHEGEIVETGEVKSFFENPEHPHSRSLLQKTFAAVGSDSAASNGK